MFLKYLTYFLFYLNTEKNLKYLKLKLTFILTMNKFYGFYVNIRYIKV